MQIATIAILFLFTKYVAKFSTSCCPAGHPFIRPNILHKMSTTLLSDFIEHTHVTRYINQHTSVVSLVFNSVNDLCGKNKKITMVRMYEIELECDALFV